jgi:hypothetical protein
MAKSEGAGFTDRLIRIKLINTGLNFENIGI